MINKNVILIGYSGHAAVAADIFMLMNYNIVGYIDKNINNVNPYKLEFLGNDDTFEYRNHLGTKLFISIGDNTLRKHVAEKYSALGFYFANAIHPTAVVSSEIILATNILIGAMSIIQSGSVIEEGVICNTRSTIEHDCTIKKYAHIAPSTTLCGNVTVGEGSLIGAGAIAVPNLIIGNNVTVGAGSVIIHNIEDNKKVAGNPSREI